MFYSNPNDHMQLTAADELIRRNWRFHKEKKIWISKTQNIKVSITIIFSRLKKGIHEPEPVLGLVGPVFGALGTTEKLKLTHIILAPRAKPSLRGGYFSCVGCWKLEEGSEGHESWIFKAGGCVTSEYENQPTKPTTNRYNQPVTHIGSINQPVFSCTRPAGHCKIRSYSIAPSLLEGVSSSSLSNSCSFKKTVTWLEKVFAQSHPRSCTPWEADEMSDKPILQGHMTHFSITWPLTISPLVFLSVESAPFHTPPLEGVPPSFGGAPQQKYREEKSKN